LTGLGGRRTDHTCTWRGLNGRCDLVPRLWLGRPIWLGYWDPVVDGVAGFDVQSGGSDPLGLAGLGPILMRRYKMIAKSIASNGGTVFKKSWSSPGTQWQDHAAAIT